MQEHQEVPIKSYSIAAYICRIIDGTCQHLIIKRTPGQLGETWQMISGLLEAGETAVQAALREIGEENGLVPERFFSANVLEGFKRSSGTVSPWCQSSWVLLVQTSKYAYHTSTNCTAGLHRMKPRITWFSHTRLRRSNQLKRTSFLSHQTRCWRST